MRIDYLRGIYAEKQYQKIDFFKKGGMGEIYSAFDVNENKRRAIKIIPVENDDEYNLLKTEFDLSQDLIHKNILKTHYQNEFKLNGVTYLYCVMDFCENGNLREYLKSQRQFIDIKTALGYMLNLAEGMDYAHRKIIHRDLKPENCLLGDDRNLLICDFGLAKLINSKTRTKTFKGSGTLPYMAPECWNYEKNTTAMDIYSLGIMFFEMLTLEMPFIGTNELEYRNKHLYEPLPSISNIRTGLPNRLVDMINKMANKRHQERYNSMSEIIQIITDLINSPQKENITNKDELLRKANRKVSFTQQQELSKIKHQEEVETKKKLIEYSIISLFDEVKEFANVINNDLERVKLKITEYQNQLKVSFLERSFSIMFYPSSDIQATIQRRNEMLMGNNMRRYGYDSNNLPKLFIQKDNVVLIGQIALNDITDMSRVWGYNLLLRKSDPSDLYGEWWVVWFNDSGFTARRTQDEHYPIGIPEFYEEYEFGRSKTIHIRTMGINTLKSEGLDKIFEKLLE